MKTPFFFIITLSFWFSYSQNIGITPFATGFNSPLEIAHPANDARLFVVQQAGAIRILNPNRTINPINFLTLTPNIISSGGEKGLLGLAFHPNYATNGYFYVNYTNTSGNTVIARYAVSTNPNVADASSGTILLTVIQPFENHNGGSLKFGPDGYLYIGMGDGGKAGDPGNRAQNLNENLGKMLRIDVDSAIPFGIPPSNPYVGIDGNDEIWAIGLRNPWKFSFNRLNNDLWIADVGQDQVEEINKVSPLAPGLNFGWKCYEGNAVFTSGCSLPTTTYIFPVAQYTHTSGACSITGGYAYTGTLYPNFAGKYFFADYCNNKIGTVNSDGSNLVWTSAFSGTNFSTFGEDINGELYIAGLTNGVIYKIEDTSLNTSTFNKNISSLYPNPATSEVFIKNRNINFPVTVSITDTTGKKITQQSLETEINSFKIGSLKSGIYIVTIIDNFGSSYNSKLSIK